MRKMETLRFLAQICHQAIGKESCIIPEAFQRGADLPKRMERRISMRFFCQVLEKTARGVYYTIY
jgi:hypothetical protein